MHIPVLLNEVIRLLDPKPGEFFIDGTINGGGHAHAILQKIGRGGKLLGVDWDERAIVSLREIWQSQTNRRNVILVRGNYAGLPEILAEKGLPQADGLLLDLGFSSEQLASGRGFSFLMDEPLLMTYSENTRSVREKLPQTTEKELADVIYRFGGERFARRIAKAIKESARKRPIRTSGELAEIVRRAVPKNYERGRIHPATRTFQALRIWANDELGNLEKALGGLKEILRPGGRVAIISFHSLEDKLTKDAFRQGAKDGWLMLLNKKPITPLEEETKRNPRSRSAKLRGAKIT